MTNGTLDFEVVETITGEDSRLYTAALDMQVLSRFSSDFEASAASFWFRFFGEVDFYASRYERTTDVTLSLTLSDDARRDPSVAAPILAQLSKRPAWGAHAHLLGSSNVDAIYITCENLGAGDDPRAPTQEEAGRLAQIRAAFTGMMDASAADKTAEADLATRIVADLLIGEFESDARGAMATVIGVWLGDRVCDLTGLSWHCIDETDATSFCIHNPARKISCFPFDAMNKRLNAREAFQPHLLAETFADALGRVAFRLVQSGSKGAHAHTSGEIQ